MTLDSSVYVPAACSDGSSLTAQYCAARSEVFGITVPIIAPATHLILGEDWLSDNERRLLRVDADEALDQAVDLVKRVARAHHWPIEAEHFTSKTSCGLHVGWLAKRDLPPKDAEEMRRRHPMYFREDSRLGLAYKAESADGCDPAILHADMRTGAAGELWSRNHIVVKHTLARVIFQVKHKRSCPDVQAFLNDGTPIILPGSPALRPRGEKPTGDPYPLAGVVEVASKRGFFLLRRDNKKDVLKIKFQDAMRPQVARALELDRVVKCSVQDMSWVIAGQHVVDYRWLKSLHV